MKQMHFILLIIILLLSCNEGKGDKRQMINPKAPAIITLPPDTLTPETILPDTIIDADYTFEEATKDSGAPESIINSLELVDVFYISTDGKIHKGQIVTNKLIADNIKELFRFMLDEEFIIEKAIPIARYEWNDSLSMADNNSYSFCYRNISYSKHAEGMAIDINPMFNPLIWKYSDKPNEPLGAVSDTTVNGTLYPNHPVVNEFRRLGFRWGHNFTKYHDDHHFEKR
ncbi:MAG: M15 family metallopeptidase [Fermentimonas sp.]|nr:M15 family metallopeptidase [Fermentimonas sp.]MDD4284078.1 M15 family metallopeptidase [Fermentimonas sp.]MDD4724743.1 M15 family metallopeptidase [Fermentimonas sp.]